MLEFADRHPEFFTCLAPDRGLGIVVVEQPCSSFDQHPVGMVVDVHRVAELSAEQDGSADGVVEEDRRAVSAVVGLAVLCGPSAVAVQVVERRLAQHMPAARQQLDVANLHARIAGQVATDPIKTDAASTVRYVDASRHQLNPSTACGR